MQSFVLYARKSTESDDRQALSIDAQVSELTKYARMNELDIRRVYTESKSAKKSGRPIFIAMLRDLRRSRAKGIICWKLDRLTRNLADGALLSEAMDDHLIEEIRTPSQTFRNTSTDRFMSGLEFLVGRKYVDDLSENVKRGFRAKLEQGWRPNKAPIGYLNEPANAKGQRTITLDPKRAPLVRKIWDLMLSGKYTVMEILSLANNDLGLRFRSSARLPSRQLSRASLYHILGDPFYCGRFMFGGVVHEGRHPPIVKPEEFDRVQELLGRKDRPRPKRHAFAFRGLLKCGQCGAAVTAEEKFKLLRSTGQRRRYVYYHCSHRKDPSCRQRSVTEDELRAQVAAFLADLTIPKDYVDWAFKYLPQVESSENQSRRIQEESLRKELKAVDAKLANLLALRIAPGNTHGELISDAEFLQQKNKLSGDRIRLRASIRERESSQNRVAELTAATFRCHRTLKTGQGRTLQRRPVGVAVRG